jgi:lactate dehydrogenase-like 2-hydroxyacid dehydrogenase/SAM-dependent methyltransferase
MKSEKSKENILFLGKWAELDKYFPRFSGEKFRYSHLRSLDISLLENPLEQYRYMVVNNFDINPYLDLMKDMELVIYAATGYNFLDLRSLKEKKINITNLPYYSTQAVSEYILWAVLHGTRRFYQSVNKSKGDSWQKTGLCGKHSNQLTAGFIGFGDIGAQSAALLSGMGMKVVRASRFPNWDSTIPNLPLKELAAVSDVLCITCKHDIQTEQLFDKELISLCKKDVTIVSISPNSVIDLEYLGDFLKHNIEASAILDLDFIPETHPLMECPNVQITPHIAFYTDNAVEQRIAMAVSMVENHSAGLYIPPITSNNSHPQAIQEQYDRMTVYNIPERRPEDNLLCLTDAFFSSQVIYTALKFAVFDLVEQGFRTIEEIGNKTDTDKKVLGLLLNACSGLGLITKDEKNYFYNSKTASRFLVSSSPEYYGNTLICAIQVGYEPWGKLSEFLKTGIPPIRYEQIRRSNPDIARLSTLGADSQTRKIAGLVDKHILRSSISGTLLDIGCGAATISRHLLKNYEDLQVTLLDTAPVLSFCKENYLVPEKVIDHTALLEADYNTIEEFPGTYDYILLSNILHIDDPDRSVLLLEKAFRALKKGGKLIAISFFLNEKEDTPVFSAMFSLSCMLLSGRGSVPNISSTNQWMSRIGYKNICFYHLTQLIRAITGVKE